MIRTSSRRFSSRHDHTFPELSRRIPRVTRRIELVSNQGSPRSGVAQERQGSVTR